MPSKEEFLFKFKKPAKELLEIINSNPDLPIVYFVNQDDCEYSWTLMEYSKVEVTDIIYIDNKVYSDKDDALDDLANTYADDEETKSMSDKEYNDYIEEVFNTIEAISDILYKYIKVDDDE